MNRSINLKRTVAKGFTLIELVVVVVILGILAAVIIPIISGMIETAQQATDNANARYLYNCSALWFSENNLGNDNLTAVDLFDYLGSDELPEAKSKAFQGTFSCSVTVSGSILVQTSKPAVYNPEIGKLVEP